MCLLLLLFSAADRKSSSAGCRDLQKCLDKPRFFPLASLLTHKRKKLQAVEAANTRWTQSVFVKLSQRTILLSHHDMTKVDGSQNKLQDDALSMSGREAVLPHEWRRKSEARAMPHMSSVLPDEGESAFAGPECTVMPICQRQLFLAFVHLV